MPLAQFQNSPAPAQDFVQTPPHFPEVPDEILQRFESAKTWNSDIIQWYKALVGAIGDQQDSVTSVVNANDQTLGTVVVQQGEMTAEIETIQQTIINNYGVLAQRIVTVSALAGSSSHITVQNAPPGGPAVNDLWVNNSVPQTPVTYKWDGAAWIEVTEPISVAAVAAEQTARITADGFLEGKYTLTVIAGNVVTGMNITSSTGGGTNVSSVIFRATDFQIYNGVIGKTMFSVSGTDVQLAGVLTVSTSGKVFTGTGTYGNNNTPFYVDSSSNFSLGASLTWNGTTLSVNRISATTGTIGGWTINASTIASNNAVLDSAGQLLLGTANNVVYLSATDATYRLWVGNVTAGSAAFSVTKAGSLFSNSGTIGGFTIGTGLSAGTGSTSILLSNDAGTGIKLGDTSAQYVWLRRSFGGSVSLLLFNASNLITANLSVDVSNGCGALQLSNNVGTAIITADASTGVVSATSFSGDGSAITTINASNIASGALSNSRLPSAISVTTLTASGAVTGGSGVFGSGEVGCGAVRYAAHNGNAISFGWDGANVRAYVDGSVQGTIPNP